MDYKDLENLRKVTQASYKRIAKSEVFRLFRKQIIILIVIDRLRDLIEWIVSLFS